MPDPCPSGAPTPSVMSRLHSWVGVGSLLAAAAVGYAGITLAQVVSLATSDDVAVTAVADPPVAAAYSTAPTAPTTPTTPTTPTSPASPAGPVPSEAPAEAPEAQEAVEPAGPDPAVVAEAPTPSRLTERPSDRPQPPSKDADPGVSRAVAPARELTEPVAERSRKEQLEIKRAKRADRQLTAMLRSTSQTMQWFGGAPWIVPVSGYHLTARFGASGRLWSSTHTGLDFAAPTGTPVRAATAGTVTSVAWAGAYGNKIEITHPDGTETWYAHLSRTDVQVGAQVATGAVIGAVGATGNVTGSHLHFEVRPAGGSPVDPERALEEHGIHP